MAMMSARLAGCALVLSIASTAPAEDWPGFRGPGGQGISGETSLPLRWGDEENVSWKRDIDGEGWSSPIVQGDLVFVTTATEGGAVCRVICLGRDDGSVRWDREVTRHATGRKETKNSYASPTPAADASRVYAVFGDGTIAAIDRQGNIAWTNRDVRFYSQHGLGASPLLQGDLLIMPFDGSGEGDDKDAGWRKPWENSFLLAVETATGKVRWRGKRGPSRIAHTTPVLHRHEGRLEILSNAGDVIQGFDPADGKLLWTVRSQGEGVVPTIVTGKGLIFTASGFEEPTIRAIRAGARGDATRTHIAWEEKKGVPMIPSMVCREPHLFAVTTNGVVTCYEAATGKILKQQRVGGNHSSSPVWAEGRLHVLSEEGETVVLEADPGLREVARNRVSGRCQASLAVSAGRIFLRTHDRLLAIGK
jgi:outer membrane protein assembly factor BamB